MKTIMEDVGYYKATSEIYQMYKEEESVFLDSSLEGEQTRYSMIGLHPYCDIRLVKDKLLVNGIQVEDTFDHYVRKYLLENKEKNDTGLPILSGAVGYFSYDYGREGMDITSTCKDPYEVPMCLLKFYDNYIIEDKKEKKLFITASGRLKPAEVSMGEIKRRMLECNTKAADILHIPQYDMSIESDFTKSEYRYAVDRWKRYIEDGYVYVANMTRQIKVKSDKNPYDFFVKLREINPSPYGAYMKDDAFQIICASPERFLKLDKREMITRPIKGTRKRGRTEKEDRELKEELLHSEKDKSELLMIVDLERNDFSQVCEVGSVQVSEIYTIEEYATVFHLIAEIRGKLREDKDMLDVINSVFPGGSITGAPKKMAMELIQELEHTNRGIYTGALGFITLDGSCDLNIMIRTALYKEGCYYIGSGGGITFESDSEFEYEETKQKVEALLQALK